MPLSPDELIEFLDAPRLAHFATVSDGGAPRVRPLWYAYEDGAFYFTTRLEVRWTGADVADGSPVAISIGSEDKPYKAVVARGRAEVWAKDRDEWLERIAVRYGEEEGRRWAHTAAEQPDRVVLRMVPEKLVTWDYGKGDSQHEEARRPR